MEDSLLRKEFRKSDVQRARNLLTGKFGDSTQTVVGYQKTNVVHKEGDVWEEDGKTWTIKNGLRSPVTKLLRAREISRIPLACPKCGKALSTRLDKKMYPIHGMCFDCVLRMEQSLKEQGLYEVYEQAMVNGNLLAFATRVRDAAKDLFENPDVFVAADEGSSEHWGKIPKQFLDSLEDWVKFLSEKAGIS